MERFLEGLLCYNKRKKHGKEHIPVTVCVAAISRNSVIFGASDRMITSGDIQFEPQFTKIFILTKSIVIQIAGDASIQAEIIQRVKADVDNRIQLSPQQWWSVKDVAELYQRHYQDVRLRYEEHSILSPLALDRNTWLTKQKGMNDALVKDVASYLMNCDFPHTAVIFSGVDKTGTHIYVVRDGDIRCQDIVGFAAIGAGEWHASSQLMFAGHDPTKDVPETLYLVFSSKKRGEVAPGVGKGTDMFAIGPALGSYAPITGDVVNDLEGIYKRVQERQSEATNDAKAEVAKYVEELGKRTVTETQTVPTNDRGKTSTN